MRTLSTLAVLTLLVSCSQKQVSEAEVDGKIISSKIYGGERVPEGKWKSVVSISELNSNGEIGESFCSGVIAQDNYILTAAHCFSRGKDYYIDNAVITFQNNDDKNRSYIKIKDIDIHHNYTGEKSSYDFAIVTLESLPDIAPEDMIYIRRFIDTRVGSEVVLVGFGTLEDGTNGVKYEAKTTITKDIGVEFIAGGDGKDTCSGDSGGPVFMKDDYGEYAVVGITSRAADQSKTYCGDKTVYGKAVEGGIWLAAELFMDEITNLDTDTAISRLKVAMEKYPNFFKFHIALAKQYLKKNDYGLAITHYEVANKLLENNVDVLTSLVNLYDRIGLDNNVKKYLNELVLLEPWKDQSYERLVSMGEEESANISRGIGYFKIGEPSMADKYLERHSYNPNAAFILAFIQAQAGFFDDALIILEQIRDVDSVDVNIVDSKGETIIIHAAYEAQQDFINELLRFNPSLEARDSEGFNLADIGWWNQDFEMMRFFLDRGVEWDADKGFNQLISFIENEDVNGVKFLLEMGIDLSIVDDNGRSALDHARNGYSQEIFDLIRRASS